MVDRDVVVDASGGLGVAVGVGVDAADAPVRGGGAEGGGDVAEVLTCGLQGEVEGPVAAEVVVECAARAVVAGSLSVAGKWSTTSKSGSLGDLEAWHSAVTMRRMASRMDA
ncbi:hypothetical protein H5400_36135 [Rhodococcus wratislaviensis]|nr:hypothetical protein [Rhodococcus sp. 3A]MBC2891037.1 hypothetical protein [Rhodococcus sp. 4CII]